MGFYPRNTNVADTAQTDTIGTSTTLLNPVRYALGSPAVPDVDFLVTTANMKVGAYTLAQTALTVPRNVTVTHTQVGGVTDTLGTAIVVGTDINGDAATETLTPSSAATVAGAKAFKTITSITGAGWVIDTVNDTVTFGFGDKLGLPDMLEFNSVVAAHFGGVREATAPTVASSATVLASNTIDLNSASDGSAIVVDYLV